MMTGLRGGLACWAVLAMAGFLPACASQNAAGNLAQEPIPVIGDGPGPADPRTNAGELPGLPPQPLLEGECGAFFWDRGDPNPLRLFENESRGVARFWTGAAVSETSTMVRQFTYRRGERVVRDYAFATGRVQVEGAITDVRDSEAIISRALLRLTQTDGSQIVRPLVGLISCQPETAGH